MRKIVVFAMAFAISSVAFSQTKMSTDTLKVRVQIKKAEVQPELTPDAKKKKGVNNNYKSVDSHKLSAVENKKKKQQEQNIKK